MCEEAGSEGKEGKGSQKGEGKGREGKGREGKGRGFRVQGLGLGVRVGKAGRRESTGLKTLNQLPEALNKTSRALKRWQEVDSSWDDASLTASSCKTPLRLRL